MKSREEILKLADEFGLNIEFDSQNSGVTSLDIDGNVIEHKSWEDSWGDILNHLGYESALK